MSALKQSILSPFRALAMLFRELRFELDDLIRFKSLSLMESERYWRVIFAQVILVAFLGRSLGAILPLLDFIDSNIVNGIVIIMAIIVLIGGFMLFALNVRITAKRLKTLHKELIEESAHSTDSNFSYFSSLFIRFITPKYFYISLVILTILMVCMWIMLENTEYEIEFLMALLAVVGTFIGLFYSIILLPNLTKVLDIKQFNQDSKKMLISIGLISAGFLLIGFSPVVNFIYAYEYSVCFLYMFYGGMGLVLLGLWQYSGTYMKIWLFIAAYGVLTYMITALSIYPYRFADIEKEATIIPAMLCFLPLLIWHIRQKAFVGVLGIIWIYDCIVNDYFFDNGYMFLYSGIFNAIAFYIFAMIGFYCVRFFSESESFFGKFIRLFSKLWICGSISGLIFLGLFFNGIAFFALGKGAVALLGFSLSLSLQRLKIERFALLLLVLFSIYVGILVFKAFDYLHFFGEFAYNPSYTTLSFDSLLGYFVMSFVLLFLFLLTKHTGADSKYQGFTHLRLYLVLCFSAMILFCMQYLHTALNSYAYSLWGVMEICVFFIILFSFVLLGLFWRYNVLFALSFVGLMADFIFFPRLSVFLILLSFGVLWEVAKILFLNRQKIESIS
ncbi:hypothetical protein LS74_002745 [Helicobacter magdeburgensis]|uniref:Uncharacterized protein n=1 Tax=Helicobacter magdeburgensis TaxID=471858 RepID=A0A4U8T3J5_9HELI|nr:hypothetical protein [Helicobacter magdeburgensis]TLD93077.1 hypothetical protein LS74_002745 [Helicobacter magdeburgensis]